MAQTQHMQQMSLKGEAQKKNKYHNPSVKDTPVKSEGNKNWYFDKPLKY